MQEILELCVRLDGRAEEVYSRFAQVCPEPETAEVFRQMAIEEHQHVEWWTHLLEAWRLGLLPDIADQHRMLERLDEVSSELGDAVPVSYEDLSAENMLAVAARMEFFMLDSVFGELLDLMQPGSAVQHKEAYSRHVERLVETIENHSGSGDLAAFLARVLRRSYRDQQALAALATRDQLTGLLNRRGLFNHLTQWLSWSERYDRPFGLVILDVDRFKEVNDRYGHNAGDRALEQVARALESAIRSSDIVGRFGGDEFLVISPEAAEGELELLLDRIISIVRGTPLVVGDDTVVLTISAGAAWLPGGMKVGPEIAIAAADRSLYSAKTSGRDQAGTPLRADSAAPA